ncbi:MAG: redoxin domain-containing protein [Anaerolineae bacterium]|nr:redoxin domain-containing protein [Anaerolineae bacterium]
MSDEALLYERRVRAPRFGRGQWLNSDQPLTLEGLRGQAVLVDIWEYSCINCLRTLPYVREWYRRYADKGLTIIGVHTPEFAFGRERQQIEAAVQELDIRYPVLMDNNQETWDAFANRFWPSKYLIDPQGYIRYDSHGEGGYDDFERAIQAVLLESNPHLDLPPVMQPLRDEDRPGAVCYRATPELHAGFQRGALGNPEGYAKGVPVFYSMPEERWNGAFYVTGAWQAGDDYLSYQGHSEGIIQLPYEAVEVNAVLTPHPDTVERMIHPQTVSVEIWQDDLPLLENQQGSDVSAGRVLVDRPRMYNLVRNPDFGQHELSLRVKTRGFALYAFSFTACVREDG